MRSQSVDAVVVGGGPAGLCTALSLHRKGLRCVVVDQRRPYIDKACGEGLMPDALDALANLGISISPAAGATFVGINFIEGGISVSAKFPQGAAIGIKRTELHRVLVQRATLAGVQAFWQSKPQVIDEHTVEINGILFNTAWLIGADGQVSPIRKQFGLDATAALKTRFGVRRHIFTSPWTDHVEVHWADCGQMYVTPVAERQVCIAMVTRDPFLKFEDALDWFPELKQRVAGKPASSDIASLTTSRMLKRVTSGNIALVGDASGSVDAITGEGLALCFRQAESLSDAIERENLKVYQQAHNRIMRLPGLMSSALLLMDRHPALRRNIFQAMSASPDLFTQMLAFHLGRKPLWEVACREGVQLGFNLLR